MNDWVVSRRGAMAVFVSIGSRFASMLTVCANATDYVGAARRGRVSNALIFVRES
jgi:hypothetical protein